MTEEIKEISKADKQLLDKIEYILGSELSNEEYDKFYNYFNEIRKPNILIDIKDVESIKDYITNLQKENENLKEENKRIFSRVNDDELLISNAMNYAELQDYKQRNEKAVEYIERKKLITTEVTNGNIIYLLNILQGGDE